MVQLNKPQQKDRVDLLFLILLVGLTYTGTPIYRSKSHHFQLTVLNRSVRMPVVEYVSLWFKAHVLCRARAGGKSLGADRLYQRATGAKVMTAAGH